MKSIYFIFLILFFISEMLFSQNYKLVWADEFDGTLLDQTAWTRETGGGGWGNNELEYYTNREENSFVKDGLLTIKAQEEIFGNRSYTSARLKTQGKKFFKYGKIEARIKLPYSQGIWPAFWLLGENISSVSWPACGEIDILEMIGGSSGANSDKKIYGTAHWDQNGHAQYGGSYSLTSGIFADDFHTFAIVWDPQKITWYVDDKAYVSIDITSKELNAFQKNFFIILNLAVGGNWPGNPTSATVFPQTMQVDYVRVYQDISEQPEINIIDPINNSVIEPGSNLTINTDVKFDGNITRVDFFQDQVKIGETFYEPYQINVLNAAAGCYKVHAVAYTDKGYFSQSNIVSIKVGSDCVEAPYKINPTAIPGIIEAENFNIGGQGTAYSDNDAANTGGKYRINEGVDIEECSDENGGYNVGWLETNEWINYLVDVKKNGYYNFEVRAASNNSSGGSFHIEFDGVNKTGTINVPNTGGWQTWTTIPSDSFQLNAGIKTMKFVFESGNININKFEVYQPNTAAQIDLLSPDGGENWIAGSIQEIRWNSLKVGDIKIGLSTNNGSTWSFISGSTTSEFGVYRWKVSDTPSNNCLIQIVSSNDYGISDISNKKFSIVNTTEARENNNVIDNFSLSQNYPNPFNPTTKIKYSIPSLNMKHAATVKLTIFNVLGNEIETLVNETKSSGEYEVNFNAGNLPSGVYYYRLQAGDFSQTKKLVLLK